MAQQQQTPKPLMALCHDALAEGVLAKHDGKLPASWIEMFKDNPAAWEQLTEAVVAAPHAREEDRPFGPEAIVHVALTYLEDGAAYRDSEKPETAVQAVRAAALPTWFYHLLEAWLKVTRLCPTTNGDALSSYNYVGPSGGIELSFNCPRDVANLYQTIWDIAEAHGGECDTICHELTVQICEDFLLDLTHDLWDDIDYNNRILVSEGKQPIVASEMSTSRLLRHFEAIGRNCVLRHIRSWIIDSGDLQEQEMRVLLKDLALELPALQQYVPCPAFSLFFYYGENTRFWDGTSPDYETNWD